MNHTSQHPHIADEHTQHFDTLPPLSLYIHIPWCVRKCPYCDFNSYEQNGALPIDNYVEALLKDIEIDKQFALGRRIKSIFFGGGTPSLFPASAIGDILNGINQYILIEPNAEITLETNPGTAEYSDFNALLSAGINRLSFGAQTFDELRLQQLGRIHSSNDIITAVNKAKAAGFVNFNIDLMHSLPGQTVSDALSDLKQAIALQPNHLSWYQLTIEPNTAFYSAPPMLPSDDIQADIFTAGQQFLSESSFDQYEVSAYSLAGKASEHNLNYWQFGDYLALGAGAHGKVTDVNTKQIIRYQKTRTPQDYLDTTKPFTAKTTRVLNEELPVEFMMNALRLTQGFKPTLFQQRTGLKLDVIQPILNTLKGDLLLKQNDQIISLSPRGQYMLNDILGRFMA